MHDDDLDAVVDAARTGDERAIGEIFARLDPLLDRYLRAKEPRHADDIGGEVWMAVAQQLGRFEGGWSALRAWVFSIATRRVADHRRRGVRRATDPVPPASLADVVAMDDPADDVQLRAAAQEATDLVVATLSADQAEVVLLRVLGDLSVDQVAEVMGRSPNWVRVNQHRAVRKLADQLGSRTGVIR